MTITLRAAIIACCLTFVCSAPHAETLPPSPIVIKAPWLRATPKSAPVAGGYAVITNKGATPDRLVSASLPIATVGQVHSMTMANGIMHMERLEKGLVIAPGVTITLSPGADHLMFIKPTAPLKEGQTIEGTMTFEKAGRLPVVFIVGGMAAKSAPGSGPHDMSDMKGMRDMKGMDMPQR